MKNDMSFSPKSSRACKNLATRLLPGAGLLTAFTVTACTSLPPNLAVSNLIDIARVDSHNVRIASVRVHEVDSRLKISGYLRRLNQAHSAIPGHIHIEVMGSNGELLKQTVGSYHRKNARSRRSYFSKILAVTANDARIVRVIYHRYSHANG